jgi:hypothetical protein
MQMHREMSTHEQLLARDLNPGPASTVKLQFYAACAYPSCSLRYLRARPILA